MGRQWLHRPSPALVVAVIALVVALGSGAYAAVSGIPDAQGVFHGCVNSRTGILRVVKSAQSCTHRRVVRHGGTRMVIPGELAISWNQQGPHGQQGTQGIQGIQGSPGSQGPTGPSNSYYAAGSEFVPTSESVPAGDYAVSGDASVGCSAACGMSCRIQLNGNNAGPFSSADTGSGAGEMSVADSASLHLTSSGTISNVCSFDSGIGTFISRNVTAIKVGSASP